MTSYHSCFEIIRTWWIGYKKLQYYLTYPMHYAHEHIIQNMEMPKPGVDRRELARNKHMLEDQYKKCKSGYLMHGMVLCDEWPSIAYTDKMFEGAYDYLL